MGQCSQAVRDRLKALDAWSNIVTTKDVIELLREIRMAMCQQTTNQAPVHSLIDAESALHKFRQTENMSNAACLEKSKGLIEVCEHARGEPGTSAQQVADFTDMDGVNRNDAVAVATAAARGQAAARDNCLATLLLLWSNPK